MGAIERLFQEVVSPPRATLSRSHALTVVRLGAAALSGALIAACFLRFGLFPLAWVAFVPLLWAISQSRSAREAGCTGLIAGLATNLPAFYWLVYTIHVFGGFGYPLALLFYLCLSLFTSLQFVLFAVALRHTGAGPLALAAPALWVTLEFLFPNLFVWSLAHCQFHAPVLMQIGELTGPYGLSFVMVWLSAAGAALLGPPRRLTPLWAAGLATLAVVAYGLVRLPMIDGAMAQSPTLRVGLVQGNVSIEEKSNVAFLDVSLEKYRELSRDLQHDTDLIVWPETVSQLWIEAGTSRLEEKDNPFGELQTHLIYGGLAFRLRGRDRPEEFNSEFLIGPGGEVLDRYDKHILMPFGEYIPMASYFPAIAALSPATGSFTAGTGVSVFDVPGKVRIGPLICYEDLVASMSRQATRAGAEVLLNVLNDAWYGNTVAPYQHQALALWRAIENRRYLLRGSNTGVTSIIDPVGRIVAEGGLFRPQVVRGTVHRLHLTTFYTRYGDLFAWAVVAAAVALLSHSLRGQAWTPVI